VLRQRQWQRHLEDGIHRVAKGSSAHAARDSAV
jgi:hypothetical protein